MKKTFDVIKINNGTFISKINKQIQLHSKDELDLMNKTKDHEF